MTCEKLVTGGRSTASEGAGTAPSSFVQGAGREGRCGSDSSRLPALAAPSAQKDSRCRPATLYFRFVVFLRALTSCA